MFNFGNVSFSALLRQQSQGKLFPDDNGEYDADENYARDMFIDSSEEEEEDHIPGEEEEDRDEGGDPVEEVGGSSSGGQMIYEPTSQYFCNADWDVSTVSNWTPTGIDYPTWNSNIGDLCKGMQFETRELLIQAVRMYCVLNNRQLRVFESKKNYWEARCKFYGTSGSSQCQWRCRGALMRKHGRFEITKYGGPHTCMITSMNSADLPMTISMIATVIKDMVKDDPSTKISILGNHVRQQYNFTPSYWKLWAGKNRAIEQVFGKWDESYNSLPDFMKALQRSNPGTVVHIDKRPTRVRIGHLDQYMFDRVFFAFKPCIDAFRHCRPVVSIDATHLTGQYNGKMFIAMAVDANQQLIPLAFMITDESESLRNWGWFLQMLRTEVVQDREGVCLISDRHASIKAAIRDPNNGWKEPLGYHRYCLRHLVSNAKKRFKDDELTKMIWAAGVQAQKKKFLYIMQKIRMQYGAVVDDWLRNDGYETWSLANDGGRRYGIMTTNLSEGFNGVLKGCRSLPIAASVEHILFRLVNYFMTRKVKSQQIVLNNVRCTPYIEGILRPRYDLAARHHVIAFNYENGVAQVITAHRRQNLAKGGNQQNVRLRDQSCTCGKWEAYKYPCSHALAVAMKYNIDGHSLLSEFFSPSEYNATFQSEWNPLLPKDYWEPTGYILIPNEQWRRSKAGRPRTSRIRNEMDERSTDRADFRCSHCSLRGHNRRSCPARQQQQ